LRERVPEGGYDVVLVDAPCSGLGTLSRRPDLLLRKGAVVATSDLDEPEPEANAKAPKPAPAPAPAPRVAIDELQRGILRTCAGLVRVGGELVYAVCTLTRNEGEGMRAWFLAEQAGAFEPATCDRVTVEALRADLVTLRPDRDGTDGFVLWRVKRVR
jgi:16S rRNA (cytosine967-C5)-methyltransferase